MISCMRVCVHLRNTSSKKAVWSLVLFKRVTSLPPNAKLRAMQQNTHGLVQVIRVITPDDVSISPTQGATKVCGFFGVDTE